MALETASYIANLVSSNPDGGDQRSTADDHLRLVKAVLLRTFPKLDSAVSLSATQVMYLNDLSASVQLQLNQLRDGSATANAAVNARYANSASTAAFIGTLPAARVPDLQTINVFTSQTGVRLAHNAAYIPFYDTANSVRTGYLQMNAGSTIYLAADGAIPIHFITNGVIRLTIGADGTITIPGAITGTISNATSAVNATNAVNATFATNANAASFATSASSAALLSGLAPSDVAGINTIAQRNSSGDLFARYINTSQGDSENPTVAQIAVRNGSDGYIRMASVAHAGQYIAGQNITGRTGTAKTLSSSAPSGGSNGDIWYQYLWLIGFGGLLWRLASHFV